MDVAMRTNELFGVTNYTDALYEELDNMFEIQSRTTHTSFVGFFSVFLVPGSHMCNGKRHFHLSKALDCFDYGRLNKDSIRTLNDLVDV